MTPSPEQCERCGLPVIGRFCGNCGAPHVDTADGTDAATAAMPPGPDPQPTPPDAQPPPLSAEPSPEAPTATMSGLHEQPTSVIPEVEPVPPPAGAVSPPAAPGPARDNNRKWAVVVGVLCLVAIGAVAAVLLSGGDDEAAVETVDPSTTTSEATTSTTTSGPSTSAEPADPGFATAPNESDFEWQDNIDPSASSTGVIVPYDEGGEVQAVSGSWIVALRSIDAAMPGAAIQASYDEVVSRVPDAELLDSNEWASLRNGYLVAFVGPFRDAGSTWDYCNSTGHPECFGAPLTQDPSDQSVRIQPSNPRP